MAVTAKLQSSEPLFFDLSSMLVMQNGSLPIPSSVLEYFSSGKIIEGVRGLEDFVNHNPCSHNARIALINLFLQFSQHDNAIYHLHELLKTHKDALAFHTLASLYEGKGQSLPALRYGEMALTLEPRNATIAEQVIRVSNQVNPVESLARLETIYPHFKEKCEPSRYFNLIVNALEKRLHDQVYRNHTPILFIGIGHSAGSYITAELSRRLGMHMWQEPIAIGQGYHSTLSETSLEKFLGLGGVNHTHMIPSPMNCEMLIASGLKKVIINIRDPRQIVLSNTYWMNELKKRHSDPGISKYEPASLKGYLPDNYFSLDFKEQVDWMLENELPVLINWMQGWLDFSKKNVGRIETLLTRFEDFKSNQDNYFGSILDFYNIDIGEWKGSPLACTPGNNGRTGAHAFRSGKIDEWREKMTPRQVDCCARLVSSCFLEQFGYPV